MARGRHHLPRSHFKPGPDSREMKLLIDRFDALMKSADEPEKQPLLEAIRELRSDIRDSDPEACGNYRQFLEMIETLDRREAELQDSSRRSGR